MTPPVEERMHTTISKASPSIALNLTLQRQLLTNRHQKVKETSIEESCPSWDPEFEKLEEDLKKPVGGWFVERVHPSLKMHLSVSFCSLLAMLNWPKIYSSSCSPYCAALTAMITHSDTVKGNKLQPSFCFVLFLADDLLADAWFT